MTQPDLEQGFKFWREEVAQLERPEKDVPYIPVLALAGIYIATRHNEALTSYAWRKAVLRNDCAVSTLRDSLNSFHKDELDYDFEIPLENLDIEPGAAMQYQFAHLSMMNGLPQGNRSISERELFLARTLGYAAHDHGLTFEPLQLTDQGKFALRNFYPKTAEMIEGLK